MLYHGSRFEVLRRGHTRDDDESGVHLAGRQAGTEDYRLQISIADLSTEILVMTRAPNTEAEWLRRTLVLKMGGNVFAKLLPWLDKGALELVQRVTGHRTTAVVLKHYFRPGREDFRAVLAQAMPKMLGHGSTKPTKEQMKELLCGSVASIIVVMSFKLLVRGSWWHRLIALVLSFLPSYVI